MTPPADDFTLVEVEVEVDHRSWLLRPGYRATVTQRLAAAMQPGRHVALVIAHERDDSCCQLLAGDVFNQPTWRT